jgi:hypothetical protein
MVFESSKSGCLSSAHESKMPSVNRRTVQRTTIAAGKSKVVIEDLHVPAFELNDESEAKNVTDDEEPGDVSTVVLVSSIIVVANLTLIHTQLYSRQHQQTMRSPSIA